MEIVNRISGLPGAKRLDVFLVPSQQQPVSVKVVSVGNPHQNGHMRALEITIGDVVIFCRIYNNKTTGMLTIQLKGLTIPMLSSLETIACQLLAQLGFGSASYSVEYNAFVSKLPHVQLQNTSRLQISRMLATHPDFHGAKVSHPSKGSFPFLVVSLQGVKFQIYPFAFRANIPSSDGACELFMKMHRNLIHICEIIAYSSTPASQHSLPRRSLDPLPIRLQVFEGGAAARLPTLENGRIDDSETESELDTPKAAMVLSDFVNALPH
jgi:hypothetical protein